MISNRPRCPEPGCPVRYRGGPDRPCADHQDDRDDVHAHAAAYGALLSAGRGVTGQAYNVLSGPPDAA